MHPDLPPDIRFHLLPKDEPALRYSFEAKRAAMGPYITRRWGWDETLQRRLHGERFGAKPFFKVIGRDQPIGTVSMMLLADHVRFGERSTCFPNSGGTGWAARPPPLPCTRRCPGSAGQAGISKMEPGRDAVSAAWLCRHRRKRNSLVHGAAAGKTVGVARALNVRDDWRHSDGCAAAPWRDRGRRCRRPSPAARRASWRAR